MSNTTIPPDVPRLWQRQALNRTDVPKIVLACLAVHDQPKLLRHWMLSRRNTRPELAAFAADRRRFETIVASYDRQYRPSQPASNASPPSPDAAADGTQVAVEEASMNRANIRLCRRLVGALFTSDPGRRPSPRQATMLAVAVADQVRHNVANGTDWTGLILSADAMAVRVGCSHRPAAADLRTLTALGALVTVTKPRPGVATRYRQPRLTGPGAAAADALQETTGALATQVPGTILAEVVDSADHLAWSFEAGGHAGLWTLAGAAYEDLLGIGPGGPCVAMSAWCRGRDRRWLAERGLNLGAWGPGSLRVALDQAVSEEARAAHAAAVTARAEAVRARKAAVVVAQEARALVGSVLKVTGTVPGRDGDVERWMNGVRDAVPAGDAAARTDLARRLRKAGWADPAAAALNLVPDASPEEVDLARRQARLGVIKQALQSPPSDTPGWVDGAHGRIAAAGVVGVEDRRLLAEYLAGALSMSRSEAKAWADRIVGDDDRNVQKAQAS